MPRKLLGARSLHRDHGVGGHPPPGRSARLLSERLQDAKLQQARVALDHLRGVREIPKRRRLTSCLLERGQPFLSRLYDLRKNPLELSRQREVLQVGTVELEANRCRGPD